jgi:hypothetical protein
MRHSLLLLGLLFVSAGCSQTAAAPIVIAGSQATAPPGFLNGGFVAMTPNLDQAFSFSLAAEGSFDVGELQIALSYSNVIAFGANSGVQFSIRDDAGGVPGTEIGEFQHADVPSTPQIVHVLPESPLTLHSGVRYWLVGQRTLSGVINVHVSDTLYGLYGPIARRSQNGDWIAQPNGSLPAFVLLGSQVPEPAAGILLLTSVAGLAPPLRRRK